jgi:glutamate-5-semialdehyde dehydrogenase
MDSMRPLAEAAKRAARALANAGTEQKNAALKAMAAELRKATPQLLEANAADLADSKAAGKNAAFLDRLALDPKRIDETARGLEEVAALPDPVGELSESWTRPNGLQIARMRLPLGVVLMIYESRPNVTADAAGLCLKSGNAVILRGGKESLRSNHAMAEALWRGLDAAGLPREAVQVVPRAEHEALLELLKLDGLIDLCIPRGGEGLIRFVAEHARIPVVKHYKGVCHVYVHSAADLAKAGPIVVNGKASRPGTCNSTECLLVDQSVATRFLPQVGQQLVEAKVELRGCPRTVEILQSTGVPVKPAADDDFGREFLDYILAIKVVDGLDAALQHIATYGSEHTEAIVSEDAQAVTRFTREVAASGVVSNASTRFNDGGELGLGAEIGTSTTRLHAFGPMGLKELTSQKFVVRGAGQVR